MSDAVFGLVELMASVSSSFLFLVMLLVAMHVFLFVAMPSLYRS